MSSGKETINLIKKYKFTNKIDCFVKCTSIVECLLVWLNQNECSLYSKIDYSNFIYSFNSSSLIEKYIPDYSAINASLINYWPFNNNYDDIVGGANMFSPSGSITFTKDRLNSQKGAVYLNKVNLRIPTFNNFPLNFTISVWIKQHTITFDARIIDIGTLSGSDNVLFNINWGTTGGPL